MLHAQRAVGFNRRRINRRHGNPASAQRLCIVFAPVGIERTKVARAVEYPLDAVRIDLVEHGRIVFRERNRVYRHIASDNGPAVVIDRKRGAVCQYAVLAVRRQHAGIGPRRGAAHLHPVVDARKDEAVDDERLVWIRRLEERAATAFGGRHVRADRAIRQHVEVVEGARSLVPVGDARIEEAHARHRSALDGPVVEEPAPLEIRRVATGAVDRHAVGNHAVLDKCVDRACA